MNESHPMPSQVPPLTPTQGDDLSRQPSLWKRALLVALRGFLSFVGLALLLLLTFVVLRIPPLKAMQTLWEGAFGSAEEGHWYALSATLVQTTPLLLTSLSIVIAWRAGLFSIGAQGQLLIGALAATALARIGEHWPAVCLQAGMLAVGVTGGAIWGWIAGWLRTRRNVQEVISTIMLNYIAQYLVSWLILGILREKGGHLSESETLPGPVLFARLIPMAWSDGIQTSLHTGVLFALIAVPVIAVLLFRTPWGFELRVLGQNAEAARVARYPSNGLRLQAMTLSGALCGLAGVIELLGSSTGSLPASGFAYGVGFTAIPVALLGGLHPIGILFSSLFFGALTQGSRNLEQNAGVSSVLIYIIQAVAVLTVVGVRAWQARHTTGETE
ncbi:MAG TPA: ABC transporter permease [Chthonomonadaceae bacterium]|nr:ABC transporter permease [Chthonomonadaceae bacterium]